MNHVPPPAAEAAAVPDANMAAAAQPPPSTSTSAAVAPDIPAPAPAPAAHARQQQLYTVTDLAFAAPIATYSAAPFGHMGQGSQLAGDILTAPPSLLQHVASSSNGEAAAGSTSFQPGDLVRVKEDPWAEGKGGTRKAGRIANIRADMSAPRLPRSKPFVEKLQSDVAKLLDRFVEAWLSARDARSRAAAPADANARGREKEPASEANSITICFESAWLELGWHHIHFAITEDLKTRRALHDTLTRVLVDAAQTADANADASTETSSDILRRTGAFLALYTFWATSLPSIDSTEISSAKPPSLFPEGVDAASRSRTASQKDVLTVLGQGWPIEIPSDTLAAVAHLPAQLSEGSNADAGAADELREILQIMLGPAQAQAGAAEAPAMESTRAFHILPPTTTSLVWPGSIATNDLTRRTHLDVQNERWAALTPRSAGPEADVELDGRWLTRAETIRASVAEYCADLEEDSAGAIDGAKRVIPGRELQTATKRTRALMLKPDAHTVAVRYKPKHAA